MRSLACLFLLLAGTLTHAAGRTYPATVTSVVDGDTVWVRPARGSPPRELRLLGIDAPESCQPWGPQARDALRRHVLARPVTVEERGRDVYGRHLARVARDGQDVGAWMVANGLAWSGRWHGRGPYDALQAQAAQARRGLWAQARPLEPARFRKAHGPCPRPAH